MKSSFLRTSLIVALFLLFSIVSTTAIYSQDLDDVSISGKVVDSNGLAVAGATITIIHTETGAERSMASNSDGLYRFIELKPGTYKLRVVAEGFTSKENKPFETVSGQNIQVDFSINPAAVNASQEVVIDEDSEPLIDVTRTVVGGTITQREIEDLPVSSRNALDLVLTLGGTSEESFSTNGLAEDSLESPASAPLEQGNFSLSGGTAYSNNITIDGMDNNDDRSSRDRFQPSIESVVEIQVISNQFSAEYGRASGGRVNIRTRAGGNKFHGRAFMFFRDSSMNSNTWYNNSRNRVRPPLTEYTPGFTFNGPVIIPHLFNGRKRTFFSLAYEYNNLKDTTQIDTYIPIVANPNYTLPTPNGTGQFCDNAISTNCPTEAGFISPYTALYSTPNIGHTFTARFDHQLFKDNEITLGFQYGNKHNRRTNGATTTRLEQAFQEKNNDTKAFNFTDNHVFGAGVVNQFRMQWSRYTPSYQTADPLDPVVLIGFLNPETNGSQTLIAGNSTTSTSLGFADSRNETRWQFQDSATVFAAGHTFKLGADIQRVDSKTLGLEDATGTFNFARVLDYSNNKVTRFRQNFGTAEDVENTYWGIFFNDQFNVLPRLTLSYGLRYERETAVEDSNNFGPRLGVSWAPFDGEKTVVRFGAGVFYNRVLLRTVAGYIQNTAGGLIEFDTNTIGTAANDPRRTAILAAISQNFPNSYASQQDLSSLVASVCPPPGNPCNGSTGFSRNTTGTGNPLRSVEPGIRIPESYQFNIGFERDLGNGFVFEANYTWNKTAHLWRDYNPNAPSLALANARFGTNYADWVEYLVANPYVLSPTRKYTFFLGEAGDGSGLHANSETGNTCTVTTVNCFVNLRTSNTSSTAPAIAQAGLNGNATGGPIGIATAAIANFRADNTAAETSRIGSVGNAQYSGLILEMRRRFRKLGHGFGASVRVAYTLSSTKDDGNNNTTNAEINGDFSREWARNLQDRRHRIGASATIETPWWFGKLRMTPLIRWGSSAPFNLSSGGADRNLDDLGTDRLNFSGNVKDIVYREPGSPLPTTLLSQFSLQPIGSKSGNLPRNAGTGPSFYTFDLSVTREWKVGDRMKFRPVIEFDNILNAAVFSYGAEFINFQALRTDGTSPTPTQLAARDNFLIPTRTYRQREIRLGFRFDF